MTENNYWNNPHQDPFIIAEMSCNHNGDLARALAIISRAKQSGASAIKLQTYRADTITIKSDRPEFQIHHPLWQGQNLYNLYEKAHTPWEWHKILFAHARDVGLIIFSAPFDHTAVDLLEELDCPIYKIASPEIVDIPLIERVAQCKKPMIISTGMASEEEIGEAIETARTNGCPNVAILHCMSAYPCPFNEMNLAHIQYLQKKFAVVVGLSDHSLGYVAPMTAVALGARIIEKHFTLSRAEGGFDAAFSSEPMEFEAMVHFCRMAYQSVGGVHQRASGEQDTKAYRRSLYVVKNVKRGEKFTAENVKSIRPSNGLLPKYYAQILGKAAKSDIIAPLPLQWEMVEN